MGVGRAGLVCCMTAAELPMIRAQAGLKTLGRRFDVRRGKNGELQKLKSIEAFSRVLVKRQSCRATSPGA